MTVQKQEVHIGRWFYLSGDSPERLLVEVVKYRWGRITYACLRDRQHRRIKLAEFLDRADTLF